MEVSTTPIGRRHFNESEVAYATLLEKPLFSSRKHFPTNEATEDGDSSPHAAKRYHAALLADMKLTGGMPRSAGGSGKKIEDLQFLNAGSGHSAWKPVTKGGAIPQPPPLKFPPGTMPNSNATSNPEPVDPKQKMEAMVERLTKPLHREGKKQKEPEVKKINVAKLVTRMEDDLRIRNTNAANRIKNRDKKEAELCKTPRRLGSEDVETHLRRLIDEPIHRKKANIEAHKRKEAKEKEQYRTLSSPRLTREQQEASARRLCNEGMDHQRDKIAAAAEKYLGPGNGSRSGSPRSLVSR